MSSNTQTRTIQLEVRCPLDLEVLAVIRTFITSLGQQMGFDETQIGEIEMAVDEACANVIRHAYKHLGFSPDTTPGATPPEDCQLLLRLAMGSGMLRIQVIDNGIGNHRTQPGADNVEQYLERGARGGLGNVIIKNFMDEVQYDYPSESGTVLTMVKYLREPLT